MLILPAKPLLSGPHRLRPGHGPRPPSDPIFLSEKTTDFSLAGVKPGVVSWSWVEGTLANEARHLCDNGSQRRLVLDEVGSMPQYPVVGSRWKASRVRDWNQPCRTSTRVHDPDFSAVVRTAGLPDKPPLQTSVGPPVMNHGCHPELPAENQGSLSRANCLPSTTAENQRAPMPRHLSPHREIERGPMIRRQPQIFSVEPLVQSPSSPWGYPSSCGAHPCLARTWHRQLEEILAVVRELELPLGIFVIKRALGLQKRARDPARLHHPRASSSLAVFLLWNHRRKRAFTHSSCS